MADRDLFAQPLPDHNLSDDRHPETGSWGRPEHESHFESMDRQKLAATLGMWMFLGSEVLFFGTLFTVFASYRTHAPKAFAQGVRDNTLWWGSTNTLILLTSSFVVALSVHALHKGRLKQAAMLVYSTSVLGFVFLGIKGYEYFDHFRHGIFPGARGEWFLEKAHGLDTAAFWNLYYLMTGLHALHVTVGIVLLAVVGWFVREKRVSEHKPQLLENAAAYWHLVDIVWLFLWPCFYLTKGTGS